MVGGREARDGGRSRPKARAAWVHTITTKDGTQIYYKDGARDSRRLSHGWPLTADAFEARCSFSRRRAIAASAMTGVGMGRSSQPWQGNDMDTYADDLATLVETLD